MLFYLLEHLPYYDHYVKSGAYINDSTFTQHFERHFHELHGMKWGIIGLGAIGSRVGEVAWCRLQVQYYSTSGRNQLQDSVKWILTHLLRDVRYHFRPRASQRKDEGPYEQQRPSAK